MYMDILFIEQLVVMTIIGIHDWERKCFQKLVLDVELAYKNQESKSNLKTFFYLDYVQVRKTILDLVSEKRFLLIEDVAEVTAKILIRDFCVDWVRITVKKPNAIRDVSNVGICIKRKR